MANSKQLDTSCVVYAISSDGTSYRYIGYTRTSLRKRMVSHLWEARNGTERQPYPWIREVGPDNVIATVLEKLPLDCTVEELCDREVHWIARLRAEGYQLLNLAAGGLGKKGVPVSTEERAARAERGRRQDLSHLHSPEIQARATAARTGIVKGPYRWTPEGATRSAEGRAKASHNRWHVARGVVNNDCTLCVLG